MDFHAHYGRLCRLRLPHSTHKVCISGKKSHSIEMPMIHYTIFSDIMQVFFRNFHNIFMQSAPTPELRQRLPYLSAPPMGFPPFSTAGFSAKKKTCRKHRSFDRFSSFSTILFFHNRIFRCGKLVYFASPFGRMQSVNI